MDKILAKKKLWEDVREYKKITGNYPTEEWVEKRKHKIDPVAYIEEQEKLKHNHE